MLNSIIFFLNTKIQKNKRYIPNETLIDIIFLISNHCKIENQNTIENILKIFQVYLKPKNINNLIIGQKRITAGKFNFIENLGLGIEWGLRKTFTDKLDGLPPLYFDNYQLSDSENNDWYSIVGVTFNYKFLTKRDNCPGVIN